MEIYFSKDITISKLTSYKEKIVDTITFKTKQKYDFFGYKFGEVIGYYESNSEYHTKYKDLNTCITNWGKTYYKLKITENPNVYHIVKKPSISIILTNGERYEKHFETDDDMENYIKKLPLTNLHNILNDI